MGNRNYAVGYAHHLFWKQNITHVAEVGILQGSGLAMWSSLYPNAVVHGFDLNLEKTKSNLEFLQSRGAFCKGQLQLHKMSWLYDTFSVSRLGIKFDLVIDGGYRSGATASETWWSFEPHLHQDSIYIIEDCLCESFRK